MAVDYSGVALQGTLNALAGTTGLGEEEAARRILALSNTRATATFSNADATVDASTRVLRQTGTMSAARVVTLPAASAVYAGAEIIVADASGSVTSTNTLTITAAGADTINGAATEVIRTAYGWRRLISDGTSKWSFDGGLLRAGRNLADVGSASVALTNLVGEPGITVPVGASYTICPTNGSAAAADTVQGSCIWAPVVVPHAMTINLTRIRVTTAPAAGALWRLGWWNLDGTYGVPGTLIADLGTVDPTTGAFKEVSQTVVLPAGRVALSLALQGTGAGGGTYMSTYNGRVTAAALYPSDNSWGATGITGALPSTAPATTTAWKPDRPAVSVVRSA